MDDFNNVRELFEVLGNPTRFRIFSILMTGIYCNCEIAEKTGFAINLISHHLKVLQDYGLVVSERSKDDSRWIYFSVNKTKIECVNNHIDDFFSLQRINIREPACPPVKQKKEKCK